LSSVPTNREVTGLQKWVESGEGFMMLDLQKVFLHSLVVVMTTTTMQVQRAVRSPSHLEWSPS
jgi:hypothetical protein